MVSTIKTELKFDKVFKLIPKEYPNWYGIPNVGFIWINEWADPKLEYKGKIIESCFYIEDTMWERFRETDLPEEEFEKWIYDNRDDVYELLEACIYEN